MPALLAGLRTRAADLALIREHTKLDDVAAPLTLATATALYRYVTLARALKMAVKDLIDLETLSGERSFSTSRILMRASPTSIRRERCASCSLPIA